MSLLKPLGELPSPDRPLFTIQTRAKADSQVLIESSQNIWFRTN